MKSNYIMIGRHLVLISLLLCTSNSNLQNIDFKHAEQMLPQAIILSKMGKTLESRRYVAAWLQSTPWKTQCLKGRPIIDGSSAAYFFPIGNSLEFAVLRGNLLQFMLVKNGSAKIVWEGILINSNRPSSYKYQNAVMRYLEYAHPKTKFGETCGLFHQSDKSYAYFDSQQPPGIVDFGVISYRGKRSLVGFKYVENLPYSLPIVSLK